MQCCKCRKDKPLTEEFFHRYLIEGKYRHKNLPCRECHKKKMREWNKSNYSKNRSYELLRMYRKTDKKLGRTNDLTVEWFNENIGNQPCTYCGTIEEPRGADRINNDEGHTMLNVIPCCGLCNKVRNNLFTVEEMKLLGQTIKQIKFARL